MFIVGCYGQNHCPPTIFYVEGLTPNVKAFGDKNLQEAIKVKCSHKNGVLIQKNWYLYKKRHRDLTLPISMSLREYVGTQCHDGCLQAKRRGFRMKPILPAL